MEDNSFPRWSELEDWNHVVLCGCTESKRNEYLGRLRKKIDKADSKNEVKINAIISDIHTFLQKESNYQTSQELIGLRNLFRGMAFQFWIGDDFKNNNDRKHNKVITK